MKHTTEGLLNTAEAARFLRVSQASIRRWADSGRLAVSRVGGRRERRFKESDLLALLDASRDARPDGVVRIGGASAPVPGHLATFYSTDEGGLRLSVPFLADGMRLGQPCLLVATEPLLSRYVAALGDPPDGMITPILFAGATAAEAIAEWERRFSELIAGRGAPLRIVGEMSCERTMFRSEDEMLRYEEAFELLSKRYPVVVICQYDAREFGGVTLLRALKAHPDLFGLRIGTFLN